jgi:hypothetical protein
MSEKADLERAVTFTGYGPGSSFNNDILGENPRSAPNNRTNTTTQLTNDRSSWNTTTPSPSISSLTQTPNDSFANQGTYNRMDDEGGIIDEEHWNWSVLMMRVFCFFLLFLIILCVGLEAITRRFLVLAAIICGFLVLVIIATYVDPRKWIGIICRCERSTDPTPARRFDTPNPAGNNPIPPTVVNGRYRGAIENPLQVTTGPSTSRG